MKRFLITRPEHDYTTHYLSKWSEKVINLATKKGIKVIDLNKTRANRKEVEGILSKKNLNLIMFNGHGDINCISGHNNEILIKLGENEKLLKSKIVYAVSCKSAKKLGNQSKTKVYIGYMDDFVFLHDLEKITHPLQDNTAKLFFEPSNEIILSLLKGTTAQEAYQRSQKMFKANINKLLTSKTPSSESSWLLRCLLWDLENQVCLGDQKATFL